MPQSKTRRVRNGEKRNKNNDDCLSFLWMPVKRWTKKKCRTKSWTTNYLKCTAFRLLNWRFFRSRLTPNSKNLPNLYTFMLSIDSSIVSFVTFSSFFSSLDFMVWDIITPTIISLWFGCFSFFFICQQYYHLW